jgi:1-acyl-sn-glycerol-3-phosphate acyltransferase
MEIFLMLVVTKPDVNIIGAGDFPLDPSFRLLARAYGYIPYKRGSVDSRALRVALSKLEADEVVGIFPEGGIWTEGAKSAQRGVAWLAAQSGAPVIPVAFAGIDRGVERMLSLQFPWFEVRVGKARSFPNVPVRRGSLDEFSNTIMTDIDRLLPEWDRERRPEPADESYSLILRWSTKSPSGAGEWNEIRRDDERAAALARFYHLPVLLSIFEINLKRDVEAMKAWNDPSPAGEVERAVNRVLGYLRLRNRHLFTYRLGQAEGTRLERALEEMRDWAREHRGSSVCIIPVRRVTWPSGEREAFYGPEAG